MKCCDNIENLGCFDSCVGEFETGQTATIAGDWTIEISYMGIVKKEVLTLELNDPLKINIKNLNEDYTYNFKIFLPDGTALNNTCYSFTIYKTVCN